MQYLLLISADEELAQERLREGAPGSFHAWITDLEERGVLRAHVGLHDSATATTVRLREGEVLLTDGPFAEGREQVGGLAVVDCADLDEAVAIAAAHPAAVIGQVEVRPVRVS
ncbi:YciI family protein [Cellulomonas xylanilytica]|uniref:Transcription initiation protein n=1 Tax=Cellulomonas xylanilytica TaxID=233583 RepID=A0A510UZS5_9CELL|nr:YciI family protein [Cellulomonas xylanilytica]GEK20158.1 transcription initiation protein [Cellulomonas xylanilytica]